MKTSSIFVSIVIAGLAAFGCSAVDEPVPEDGRESLWEAEEEAREALEDYAVCVSESADECVEEQEGLVESLEELDLVDGDIRFRAGSTATCEDGSTVSCSGDVCIAIDEVGCGCTSTETGNDIKACPVFAPVHTA
ncbi:MAG: hypothetical protein AAF799_13225 [Myxococcota bacterium]